MLTVALARGDTGKSNDRTCQLWSQHSFGVKDYKDLCSPCLFDLIYAMSMTLPGYVMQYHYFGGYGDLPFVQITMGTVLAAPKDLCRQNTSCCVSFTVLCMLLTILKIGSPVNYFHRTLSSFTCSFKRKCSYINVYTLFFVLFLHCSSTQKHKEVIFYCIFGRYPLTLSNSDYWSLVLL